MNNHILLLISLLLALSGLFFVTGSLQAQSTSADYYERGYRYLTIDKRKAIDLLSKSIDLDPQYGNAYFHRGIAYFKLNDYDSALADFGKAYQLNPDLSVLLLYQGFAHRNKGEFDLALKSFSDYITQHPRDTAAYSYILKGKMKYELGDFKGAVSDYNMASRLKPFEEKYNYYKYVVLKEAGDYAAALQCTSNLIAVNPDFYGYFFYKGQLFHELGHYDSAIYMYNISIIKNLQNSDSYYYRAKAYEKLGKPKKALDDYNKAIQFNRKEALYFSDRGNCRYRLEDVEGACKDWAEAGELGFYEDFDKLKSICN